MRVLIILCFFTFFLRTYSQQYERGKKNYLISAEFGSLISKSKVFSAYDLINGNSFGIGFGKKLSSFLPISIRFQYNYQNVKLPVIGSITETVTEHILAFPIQYDIHLFSIKLEKSQHSECRKLFTGVEFSLIPELSLINNEFDFHRRYLLPIEIGLSFKISKSGGHKSVMKKDIHFYLFTRMDFANRIITLNDNLPIIENLIGLRIQFTKFSVWSFTQLKK